MIHIERILAISDIHGSYNEFIELLEQVNYNSTKDQLILVGDYTDRGFQSKQVLDKIIKLTEEGAIALRGNHDQMYLDWLTKDDYYSALNFFRNGGFSTLTSYVGYDFFESGYNDIDVDKVKNIIKTNFSHHIEFLRSLKYYHETPEYIFVHAGINPHLKDWKNTDLQEFIWIRDQFLNNEHELEQTIIHGHTPTINLHNSADIFFGNKKIDIDGGCAYGYQLNCLEIKDGEYKQHTVYKKRAM